MVELFLPWFATAPGTKFHPNLIMTFQWSYAFKILTAEWRNYAVISCNELHCDSISTSQPWTASKLH